MILILSIHGWLSTFCSSSPLKERLVYRLRWVTLGYHYDWDSKTYHPSHHTHFPQDLAALSQLLVAASGWEGFRAEAGIVNYYHMDSTLSPHTDHSEPDITAPLVSIRLVVYLQLQCGCDRASSEKFYS